MKYISQEVSKLAQQRIVSKILKSKPTIEGAGVHLKRAFGYYEVPLLDPFLLFDDFHSNNPQDYIAGFPRHPHRGIETVTYMIHGNVQHEDSIGNKGIIQSGDIQWMTAGSGIIHAEMPAQEKGMLWGFQLWVNLPASEKMMDPRYQEVQKEKIPVICFDNGICIKIICGTLKGTHGPVKDIIVDPEYLDIEIPSGNVFEHQVKSGYTVFAYVLKGKGYFDHRSINQIGVEHLVVYGNGDNIKITSEEEVRFLLISGKPIGEPIAWRGPIVMNTQAELDRAFEEYWNGTFIKSGNTF